VIAPGPPGRRNRAGAAVLLLLAGCAAWDPAYHFQPDPAVLPLTEQLPTGPVEAGRIEASVLGGREASGAQPATLHVRVRVERHGSTVVNAPPAMMILLTADQRRLPFHEVQPADARSPSAGGAETCIVLFEVPPPADLDDLRLATLELVFWTQVGDERRLRSLRFDRELPAHPWWNPWGAGPE